MVDVDMEAQFMGGKASDEQEDGISGSPADHGIQGVVQEETLPSPLSTSYWPVLRRWAAEIPNLPSLCWPRSGLLSALSATHSGESPTALQWG